jgi:DNA-binding NarL/FixJ family response regulator
MHSPIVTPRAVLHAIIDEVARELRLDPEQIKGSMRTREIVHSRTVVAKRLFARGLPEQRVADMMHVSLGTVRIYLGRRARPDSKVTHHREDARS